MKKELNIAAILKDKPKGTKLWSPISGDCKYEYLIHDSINVWFQGLGVIMLSKKGKWNPCGETIIFPSKRMQDWSKFAWKKGDILVSNDNDSHIIFEGFSKDDYTTFEGKHWTCVSIKRYISYLGAQNTQDYHIEDDKEAAQTYINTIEERFGGKLNLETMKIEKQPEFKDGDIVTLKIPNLEKNIRIFKEVVNKKMYENHYYVGFNFDDDGRPIQIFKDYYTYTDNDRPATDSEKQQLFDALAKEGKRWNPDTKSIEDLPKKCEFKAFDKVLVRDCLEDKWMPNFFSCYDETSGYKYGCIAGNIDNVIFSKYCIPYNEETAHLLGTTDEWKGGEQ